MTDPVNRREFLATVAAMTAAAVISLPVLQPAALAARKRPVASDKPIDCGPLTAFAKDGVTDTWAKTGNFFVVRTGGKLIAVSNICTHRFYPVRLRGDEFFCNATRASSPSPAR